MTIKEFKENAWNDLVFSYKNRWYYICPIDNKFSCGEADHDDIMFESVDDVLDNFIIDNQPFKNILAYIEW